MRLKNETTQEVISEQVETCFPFFKRAKGLLGRTDFSLDQSLWIKPCNNIHTLFMKFPLDLIFIDKNFRVVATHLNVQPGRWLIYEWKAYSVFEFTHSPNRKNWAQIGDFLYVGT